MLVHILLATTVMMSPATSVDAPEGPAGLEEAPAMELALERPEPHNNAGVQTRCIKKTSGQRVFARAAGQNANCPQSISYSGGHFVFVDGLDGTCEADATCNDGGLSVTCTGGSPGSCSADRVSGDGRVECNGTAFTC